MAQRDTSTFHKIPAWVAIYHKSSDISIASHTPYISQIMLPAILVHGTFDFTLFALAAVTFTYNITDSTAMICAYTFNVALTIASAIYAYRALKEVHTTSHQLPFLFFSSFPSLFFIKNHTLAIANYHYRSLIISFTSSIWHLLFDIFYFISSISYLPFDIFYLISFIWYLLFDVQPVH